MTIILALLISAANTCAGLLVADDPYPLAEIKTESLIELYSLAQSKQVRTELEFRKRAGMLTAEQIKEFENE